MLMPGMDVAEALKVAEKVRSSVEALAIPTEDGEVTTITVSIGLNSVIPDDNTNIGEFVNKADQALYKAKETGRNRVVIA
jgi:diguanylate cyclase (GGDEF)-like protein